jgi:hypothetical protein
MAFIFRLATLRRLLFMVPGVMSACHYHFDSPSLTNLVGQQIFILQ